MFWSYTFCVAPVFILCGILSFFNIKAMYFNDTPVYGIKALIISILSTPFFGLIWAFFNWLMLRFGGFLYDNFLILTNKSKTGQPNL